MRNIYILILSAFLVCVSISKLNAQAPGGVNTPAVWYRADAMVYSNAGTTAVTDNASIQQWNDYMGTGYNLIQATAAQKPVYSNITKQSNFNPTVNFSSPGHGSLQGAFMAADPGTGNAIINRAQGSIYIAGKMTTLGAAGLAGFDQTMDYPGLHISNNATTDKLLFYSAGSGYTTISNNLFAANKPFVAGSSWLNATGSTTAFALAKVWLDGNEVIYNNTIANINAVDNASNRVFRIGRDTNWGSHDGQLNEILIYQNVLTLQEKNRLESYLAIKYGATISGNYVNSTNGVVWNTSVTYQNNILGIARDDNGALYQKQSRSENPNQKLIIGTGIGLFNSNALNINTFNNGQFLLVGDNGLKQSLTMPMSYTSGTNGHVNFRFESVWKVQNTNAVGSVTIAWPKGIENMYLVQSSDETFASGNTFTPMTTEVVVNGVTYNTATVNLTDGQFFTFAGFIYAPGGVETAAWYRADAVNTLFSDTGITNVTDASTIQQWNEFNNKPFPLSQSTATYRPQFSMTATRANFNPTVNYAGAQIWLQYNPADAQGYILDRSTGALFSAGNTTAMAALFGFGAAGASNTTDDPGLYSYTGNKFLFYPVIGEFDATSTYTVNGPYIGGGTWQNTAGTGGTNAVGITLNGYHQTFNSGISNVNTAAARNVLMIGGNADNVQLNGQQNEMIIFPNKLTAEQINRVESYLAIKYGQTLSKEQSRNYLSSTGSIVWDGTVNNTYYNNVFGIARDNISALHQKQSRSENASQKLIIGTGSGLFNANADNTNNLVEGQFLMVGDNGLKQSFTTPLVYTTGSNGQTNFRFESIWKVQNTGNIGNVTVAWPKGVNNLYLVQSPDAVFDVTDTFTPMAAEVTVNGVVYNTANVTLADGQFFTFAGFGYAPGGVTSGLSYWYRADKNAANTGPATDVTGWTDVWNGTTVAQLGTNAFPKYVAGSPSYFNFNPGINFTAVTQTLGNTSVQTISALEFDIFTLTKENILGSGNNNRLFSSLVDNNLPAGAIERWDGIGLMTDQGYPNYVERVNNAYGARYLQNPGSVNRLTTIPSIMYHRFTDLNISKGLNGAGNGANATHTSRGLMNGGHAFGDTRFSGNGSDNGGFTGNIGETIIYGAGNLTATERRRVDSYLAIKYGITLGRVDTDHYLDADAAVIWNGATNTAYNNNIFGIAREDIGLFEQKVSKSVNAGSILTVATSNDFVNPNDNVARSKFVNDKAYFLLGDNNVTGTNLASITVAGNTWKRIQKAWLSQRKNTSNELYFEADLSTYGSNFGSSGTVWMLIADDASFTSNVKNVAGTYNNGKWVFSNNFNAENVQRYITFAAAVPNYCVTGDCNPNTFLNTSDPNTIEYDNMVSTFHSTMMRDATTGALMVWGENMANNGSTSVLSPIEVNNTNYPALTGDILKFAAGSSSQPNVQGVVLTTDGLFAWGNEGYLISTSIPSSTTFQKISVGTYNVNGGAVKTDGLPDGVTPGDVKMLFGSYKTLALTTCSGEVWVLAQNSAQFADGVSWSSTNEQLWHRVHIDASTTLDNVVAVRGNGSQTLMALTAMGEVYTWGQMTWLGDGSSQAIRAFATKMTLPAGVTPKMIGSTGSTNLTYYILSTNGNLYSLGTNSRKQLGNFTNTTSSSTWVQVQKSATAGDYLTNVVWISPNEHDYYGFGSINVLTANGRLWAWGSSDAYMLGEVSATIDPTEMPGSIPSTDPYNIGKLNWTDKVIAAETGGHTSMIVKDNTKQFGYVGHRVNGSMGDGTSSNTTEIEYNFADTPEINLCGAKVVGTPFPCDGTAYLLKGPTTGGQLFKHNLATGATDPTPIASFGGLANALGYSPIDNTLWALVTTGPLGTSKAKLTRVDGAGVVTTFDVPNLSTALGINPTAAGVTPNGYYVAKTSASTASGAGDGDNYVVIDINPSRPATYLQIVDPANSYAVATAPYYKETVGNVGIGVTDFTYNPGDGLFYGVNSAANVITFNPATGAYVVGNALSLSSGLAMPASATYNSTYIDATGALYAVDANGNTYRISIPSGNAVLISNAGTISNGDGASCATAVLAYTVQGNAFNDSNGLNDGIVNGTPTNLGNALNAILYNNTTGTVAAVNVVAANGTFAFGTVPGNSYTVYITTNTATVGQTAVPVLALPPGYGYTGEYNCVNAPGCAGNDGTADGILSLGVVNGNISQANFGVNGICTQPGAGGVPVNFTQVGISDRSGAVGTWPANVPNGFMAIQSANKGFVITRLSTAQINSLNAVEGMLVYDTDAQCIKLYNGTVWNCIVRSCNQ